MMKRIENRYARVQGLKVSSDVTLKHDRLRNES